LTFLRSLRNVVIGQPLDPMNVKGRENLALAAFLAWVGLGADGLSSAAYGPQEAFLALGANSDLGLYLALATAVTVFIIALAYNQVIELFPTGGGGYRVTTSLLGPYAGLVAGAALIVDYVLTIAISVASGIDQLFSLLPHPEGAAPYKLWVEIPTVLALIILNLRGMKESIQILLPIFLGFVFTIWR
jgi:amino acid transporter